VATSGEYTRVNVTLVRRNTEYVRVEHAYLFKGDTKLKTLIRSGAARRDLSLALAFTIGMLALSSVSAHAAVMDPITVSAPKVKVVKVVGRDSAINAPIEDVTATAVVKFDPVTLTTNSGVALLMDGVWSAAFEACEAAAPFSLGDGCVNRAVLAAQPQVDAAIARARSSR
jgi:hypothetical protein